MTFPAELQPILQHMQAGEWPAAAHLLRPLAREFAEDATLLLLLASCEYELHDYEVAETLALKVVAMLPTMADGWGQLGLIQEALHKTKEALLSYQKACDLEVNIDFALNYGGLLQRLLRYEEARQFYLSVMSQLGPDPELLCNLAKASQDGGHIQEAEALYQQILQNNPDQSNALLNLGNLLHSQHRFQESWQCYERLIQVTPPQSNEALVALMSQANWHLVQGDLASSGNLLEKGFQLSLEDKANWQNRLETVHRFSQQLSRFESRQFFQFIKNTDANEHVKLDAAGMLIFSNCGVSVMGGGQQPPQLARAFSALGHHVLYVQTDSPLVSEDRFPVWQDPFFFQRFALTSFQQTLWEILLQQWEALIALNYSEPPAQKKIALFTIFSPYLNDLASFLKTKGYTIVYCSIDDHQAFQDLLPYPDPIYEHRFEQEMIARADHLFATSTALVDLLNQQMTIQDKPIKACSWLPNGFSDIQFPWQLTQNKRKILQSKNLVKGEKTLIYWGNIISPWMHYDLLRDVAEAHPEWQFNLIGPTWDDPQLVQLPNVHYLGIKKVQELYEVGLEADIAFLNFLENPLTWSVNPVKVYEYLACGLPVISTHMADMPTFPNTWLVKTSEDFEKAVLEIEQKNAEGDGWFYSAAWQEFMTHATWQSRAQSVLEKLNKI
jgi:tetratricopeptide (TPR) repeat protein